MNTETITTSEAMDIIDGIEFEDSNTTIEDNTIVIEQTNQRTNKDTKITFERIEDKKSLVVLDNSAFMTVIDWSIEQDNIEYKVELDQPFNFILPADPFKEDTEDN